MLLLDTSFIVALFIEKDNLHKKALSLLPKIEEENCFITEDIVKELITVLNYKHSTNETIDIMDKLKKEDSFIQILPEILGIFEQTFDVFKKLPSHKFSYADCLLISLSEFYNAKILTFDKKLNKILGQKAYLTDL